MAQWVDFKELRAKLDFAAVLKHYKAEVKLKGKQHQGFCPLPNHGGSGKRRSPSFSANLEKGIFQCFGCGAKGNVIEFAALMEGLDPKNKDDFRQAALILQERFGGATIPAETATTPGTIPTRRKAKDEGEAPKRVVINAPLDFRLDGLDDEHPYLFDRGFNEDTIERFGLGYCSRGLMKGRIAIPLFDATDKLVGYAGRLADDEPIREGCPKYLFPSSRERDGTIYEFHKSLFLYNGSAIGGPVEDLIVVEGFASVWWLWQCGYRHVVAVMGSACSPEQAALIVALVTRTGRVWVFPDGDEAGTRCLASVFHLIAEYRMVRWAKLANGRQPTDCTPGQLAALLWPLMNEESFPGVCCERCGEAAAGRYEHDGQEEILCGFCLLAAHDGSLFQP